MISKQQEYGFSLVELLIAIAIGGILLASICQVFITQNQSYNVQAAVAEMQQNARAAMDMMTRELRMAGYDPAGSSGAGMVSIAANSVSFTQDLNGDGDTADADESVTYSLYTDANGIQCAGRNTGGGNQPLASNIQSLSFSYRDSSGSATAVAANVRQIQISIAATTATRDPNYPANGGYRTCTLISYVTPRNLAY